MLKEKNNFFCFIRVTSNNTILTLTDSSWKVLTWSSAGSMGFKGSRRSTAYAAEMSAKKLIRYMFENQISDIHVLVKGSFVLNRIVQSVVRDFSMNGINVISIKDISSYPHNGCRLKKTRRV